MDANMKWIGWLAKWAAGALLAAALSVLTTFYMVESYMDALLDRWNLGSLEAPELDLDRLFSMRDRMAGTGAPAADRLDPAAPSRDRTEGSRETGRGRPAGGALKVDASPAATERPEQPVSGETGESGPASGFHPDPSGKEEDGAASGYEPVPDALPVFGQTSLQDGFFLSAEAFNEKRKNLSEADKLEIFTILLNDVPQEELQRLSELVEDGITAEEAALIAKSLQEHLGPDELERLLAILHDG